MKKELIEKIMSMTHPTQDLAYIGKGYLKQILEEELPDFSRIDEERFKRIYASKVCDIGLHIKEYNSTLPPALQPLPKEMPKDLTRFAMGHDVDELWDKIISEYGTPANKLQPLPKATPYEFVGLFNESHSPRKIWEWLLSHYGTPEPKPNLPSYHDLFKELYQISVKTQSTILVSTLTKHIIKKYSLHPHQWWQDLKEGDKFMWKGQVKTFRSYEIEHKLYIEPFPSMVYCPASDCTPYTPPTAQDIIAKHNLSEEEVKILREGKCT